MIVPVKDKQSRADYGRGYAKGYEAGYRAREHDDASPRRRYQLGYIAGYRAALGKISVLTRDLIDRANGRDNPNSHGSPSFVSQHGGEVS